MTAAKKSRSGTSRTYEARAAAGRPNVTFSITSEALAALNKIATAVGRKKSALIIEAIDDLVEKYL